MHCVDYIQSRVKPFTHEEPPYTLRIPGIVLLHLILLNLHGTRIRTGTGRVQPDDPHRGPLPFLSNLTPHIRALQTVYRRIPHTVRLVLQRLFPLFLGRAVGAAPTHRARWLGDKIQDLECVEIWEGFARNDQF